MSIDFSKRMSGGLSRSNRGVRHGRSLAGGTNRPADGHLWTHSLTTAPIDAFCSVGLVEHSGHAGHPPQSLNRLAFSATVHCLTGCAIGEVLGLVIATALGWHDLPSIVLAIILAFVFGYGLTLRPLIGSGIPFRQAMPMAFAADTASITVMEIVDNVIVVAIPGAMAAGLLDGLFWGSLAVSLVIAGAVAWPVNRWLIARGRGHAVVHGRH
jgi:hypothetical protein